MSWVDVKDVKEAINYPMTDAPVSDNAIYNFILDAQSDIEEFYKTKFGFKFCSGSVESATDNTITVSQNEWVTDELEDLIIYISSGTGSGQYRKILSNSANSLTVYSNWDTNPDDTSTYKITYLGYQSETVDGTGVNYMFVTHQPLVNLLTLAIDGTTIDTDDVYVYEDGQIVLKSDASESYFKNTYRQLISLSYIYGEENPPRIIRRLCIIVAGIKTLVSSIGGTFDDFTTVSLPGFEGSKGEPYTNLRETVQRLQKEVIDITTQRYVPQIEVV